MADEDLVDMMTGKLNPQKAFFKGKLKIQGNMGLAMKLQEFQKRAMSELKSKLWTIWNVNIAYYLASLFKESYTHVNFPFLWNCAITVFHA